MLQLSSAIGNQAFGRMLQRAVWEWDGGNWTLVAGAGRGGRPKRPGRQVGQRYDDQVEDLEEPMTLEEEKAPPQGTKRKRVDEEPEDTGEGLLDWLETSANVQSEYKGVGPARVNHRVAKNAEYTACFEWALNGSSAAGPRPEAFWQWFAGLPYMPQPDWVSEVAEGTQRELKTMMRKIKRQRLVPPLGSDKAITDEGKQAAAKEMIKAGGSALVQQCGFTLVDEAAAAGWVTCQYKPTQGASFPEHWWLEMKQSNGETLVLQNGVGPEGHRSRCHQPALARREQRAWPPVERRAVRDDAVPGQGDDPGAGATAARRHGGRAGQGEAEEEGAEATAAQEGDVLVLGTGHHLCDDPR